MKTALVILFLTVVSAFAQTDIATKLQSVGVTVVADHSQGSGTIVTRGGVNFVITAGHCLESQREVVSILEDGKIRFESRFAPIQVTRGIYVDGRCVGKTSVEAEVVAYSSATAGQDIGLLKLRSQITSESIEFCPDRIVPTGTELAHLGSLLGEIGADSFTVGSLSQVGRVLHQRVYDQVSCPSFPGSSGGSVCLRSNGQYIGMLVRGAGENFALIVPLRRMREEWAKAHHVEFLFDPKGVPDLSKVRLEVGEPVQSPNDQSASSHTMLSVLPRTQPNT